MKWFTVRFTARFAEGLAVALVMMPIASLAAQELPEGEGRELVRAHCGVCHSLSLVTTQRGDAAFWLKNIRWMQRTQNLWSIVPEQEALLVSYLAQHFSETEWGRRPPLEHALRPPG